MLANRKAEIRQKGRLAEVRRGFSGIGEIMQACHSVSCPEPWLEGAGMKAGRDRTEAGAAK
jgi:hypothetical protein